MKRLLIQICLFTLFSLHGKNTAIAQRLFGNEWLNQQQRYFRIPIIESGFYKITGQELLNAGLPLDSIPANALQIFRHGRELAIEVKKDISGRLTADSYIGFYGQKNDGFADSALYIRPDALPHSYYSLYSDTASYFLTWRQDAGIGKRILPLENNLTDDTISYHFDESVQLFTSFYAPGNFYPPGSNFETGIASSTYDVGEGWTGPELKDGQWGTISFQTENAIREKRNDCFVEIVFVGRSAGNHEVEVWIGTKDNPGRKVNKFILSNYGSKTFKLLLNQNDIPVAGKVSLSIVPVNNTGSISVSAVKWRYQQKTILPENLSQKYFYFDSSMAAKTWIIKDSKASLLYDCSDSYNPKEIKLINRGLGIDKIRKIISIREFLKVQSISSVHFQKIDADHTDYLMITHPLVRQSVTESSDPVAAYAAYRSTDKGGNYHPLIINIQEVYDRFNYGDPGPLGLRNLIKWLNQENRLRSVFLIGKSIDPQTARKSSSQRELDMVPNGGWPGSDLSLAMEIGESASYYVPSVPVGRINVSNSQQVWTYLKKVIRLESQSPSAQWRKNILHLSGGRSAGELSLFRDYVHSFESKIKNSTLAASVTTISKRTDDPVEIFQLDTPINNGVALMTLFGHSGPNVTDLDIGYASDAERNYKNAPFYPAVIVNGCATGSIFYSSSTISSDWTFTPENGSVLFLAHTFNGVSTSLKRYTDSFYEVLADSSFVSKPFGILQKEAIRRNMLKNPTIADVTTAQQMNLQGDPAIRIFPARLPDYALDSTLFTIKDVTGKTATSESDSLNIQIGVTNGGRFHDGNYKLSLKRDNGRMPVSSLEYVISPTKTTDTLVLKIPNIIQSPLNEFWTFSLDPENLIPEENELNNKFSIQTSLPEGGAIPILPLTSSVTNELEIELIAQVPVGRENDQVTFEWDFTQDFTSPNASSIYADGLIARTKIVLREDSAQKIYWRVYLSQGGDRPSGSRSFEFIPSGQSNLNLPEVVVSLSGSHSFEVQEGDFFRLNASFQNISSTAFTDSVRVSIVHSTPGKTTTNFVKVSSLNAHETRAFELTIPTMGKQGQNNLAVTFNDTHLPEAIYTNNSMYHSFVVITDMMPPILTVSLDNRQINDNEVVSASPLIGVQINDESLFLIRDDTSGIDLHIKEDCQICPEQSVYLKNALVSKAKPNNFLLKVQPAIPLKSGTYILSVKARDVSKNLAPPYRIRFRVQESPLIAKAGVSPNPAGQWLKFYMDIEGAKAQDLWTIIVKNVQGKEIKTIQTTPHLGRNEVFWQPDNLPAGILLYKMELSNSDCPFSPEAQKGMNGKIIWIP